MRRLTVHNESGYPVEVIQSNERFENGRLVADVQVTDENGAGKVHTVEFGGKAAAARRKSAKAAAARRKSASPKRAAAARKAPAPKPRAAAATRHPAGKSKAAAKKK